MASIHTLAEPTGQMTYEQARDFLARTRRQISRFESLPHSSTISGDEAGEILRLCDELEADINTSLS